MLNKTMEITNKIPKAVSIERLLLGLLMNKGDKIKSLVKDKLKPNDFWDLTNKKIYSKILDLDIYSLPVLNEKLKGKASYIAELYNLPYSERELDKYVEQLRKVSNLRKLIAAGAEMQGMGIKEDMPLSEILSKTNKILGEIDYSEDSRIKNMETMLLEAMQRMEDRIKNDGGVGVESGFIDLDSILHGFKDSSLNIIAARPSIGKTSLAMNMAMNMAKAGDKVLIFSLEQSSEELIDKLICQDAGISLWGSQSGKMSKENEERYFESIGRLGDMDIMIDDTGGITPNHIKATIEKHKNTFEPDIIILDYLQLMDAGRKTNSRVEQVSYISGALKSIAKEYKVPMIALAQLSRAVEARGDNPRLSDLRDSGAIEQDADVVIFVTREKSEEKYDKTQLVISKHRAGMTGIIDLLFEKKSTSFINKAK